MKKIYLLFSLVFVSQVALLAQIDCSSNRYFQDVFTEVEIIKNIKYGENINRAGMNEELFMDVFLPKNDTETNRPLIILAHGGFFQTGNKQQEDVVPIAEALAKKGYVTVSIDYRKGIPLPIPDSVGVAEAVVRGYHDGKACVRFFRKDVAENGNTYGINTNHIYVGGNSAGGFLGLHLAYVDDVAKLPNFIDTTGNGLQGGAEGLSGNAGYSSLVAGVINIAGAIGDTSWIDNPNISVLSMHGDNDATVPFGRGQVRFGMLPLIGVDGSQVIHERLDNIAAFNCFKPFFGRGHTPHTSGPDNPTNLRYLDSTVAQITNFLVADLCGEPLRGCANVEEDNTSIFNQANETYIPYGIIGNPSVAKARFLLKENVNFQLFDITGKLIIQENQAIGYKEISLTSGIYILKVENENRFFSEKLIVK